MTGSEVDAAVAGAGPAGAQYARHMADRGYDVVVLETEAEDVFPAQSNKSTAGTFPRTLTRYGIPDDTVMHFTDSVVLESPNDYMELEQAGAVLDFGDFKQWLVDAGRDAGAEYRFDARANEPIIENGTVQGIRYNGDEEVYADIVVDATGPAAALAEQVDVVDLERRNQAAAMEYELDGVTLDHPAYSDCTDAMMLRLDHDIAPGGYSWIFHTGGDTAKVGLTYIQNDIHEQRADGNGTIKDYLEEWIVDDPRFSETGRTEIEPRDIHVGSAHIQLPEQLSGPGFLAVGDVAPTIDPVWGEGIHDALQSATYAAKTSEEALLPATRLGKDADTSAAAMAAYDEEWWDGPGADREQRLLRAKLLYMADNDRFDRLVGDLNRMDGETLSAVNTGKRRDLLKVIHLSDTPLLARFAARELRSGDGVLAAAQERVEDWVGDLGPR